MSKKVKYHRNPTRDISKKILNNWKQITRFKLRIDKTPGHGPNGDCWLWIGANSGGRGKCWIDGDVYLASRIAYVLGSKKSLRKGIQVLHKCDFEKCVRFNHLFLGSQRKNMKDASRKGRMKWKPSHVFRLDHNHLIATRARGDKHWRRTHPELIPRGSKVNTATLTEKEVLKIKKLGKRKKYSEDKIAKRFNSTKRIIHRILIGETWKWLSLDPGAKNMR